MGEFGIGCWGGRKERWGSLGLGVGGGGRRGGGVWDWVLGGGGGGRWGSLGLGVGGEGEGGGVWDWVLGGEGEVGDFGSGFWSGRFRVWLLERGF